MTPPTQAGAQESTPGESDQRDPSRRAGVIAIVGVISVAAAITLFAVWDLHVERYALGTALLATLAALGGASPVRIPSFKTSISITDTFMLTALAALGPYPACVVAIAGVSGSVLGGQMIRRPSRLLFNLGNVIFSTGLGAAAYLAVGGRPGSGVLDQVVPLFVAMLVYLAINTLLVSLAVVVDTGGPFVSTWREATRWAAVSATAGVPLATGLLWAIGVAGPSGLALGVPPLWLLVSFYRTHKERQERSQERILRVEEINEQLEDKVTERTQELREALSQIEGSNQQLVNANERLREANRAKSEFLANVSHELRTPLNAVIGFSDLLQDSPLDPRQLEFVGDIHDSGEHLLRLINDILDLSKMEAGKMEVHYEKVDVARAVSEAVAMVRPQAVKKSLQLSVRCEESIRFARLDPGMFRQALVNLLSNAVKFTGEGGRIEVVCERAGDDLVASVNDTGIGIPAEDVAKIFTEFYQVDGSYSRNYEGTGLGLALVRRMVELQDGRVSLDSEPGRGSRFSLRFREKLIEGEARREEASIDTEPLADVPGVAKRLPPAPTPETPGPPRTPSHTGPNSRRVLVVEDNAVNRKLVRNVLKRAGFEVHEVTSGEDALEWLKTGRPGIVLMDIQLPGMDGLEVTRRIKADPRFSELPIVALTAHAHETDAKRAEEAGCAGYITKPIRLSQFPKQVAAHLTEREPVTA